MSWPKRGPAGWGLSTVCEDAVKGTGWAWGFFVEEYGPQNGKRGPSTQLWSRGWCACEFHMNSREPSGGLGPSPHQTLDFLQGQIHVGVNVGKLRQNSINSKILKPILMLKNLC